MRLPRSQRRRVARAASVNRSVQLHGLARWRGDSDPRWLGAPRLWLEDRQVVTLHERGKEQLPTTGHEDRRNQRSLKSQGNSPDGTRKSIAGEEIDTEISFSRVLSYRCATPRRQRR